MAEYYLQQNIPKEERSKIQKEAIRKARYKEAIKFRRNHLEVGFYQIKNTTAYVIFENDSPIFELRNILNTDRYVSQPLTENERRDFHLNFKEINRD